jgi:hypothetical protein
MSKVVLDVSMSLDGFIAGPFEHRTAVFNGFQSSKNGVHVVVGAGPHPIMLPDLRHAGKPRNSPTDFPLGLRPLVRQLYGTEPTAASGW